ncbi:hypothetical protein LEL_06081 [Akanthomyces lecanii RCEF 1005]|uniref:Uncharacterized protein n=1 Tax=Akanthomyces lecanii RCEF 1005 TaxID=1081108 RepID=A0A168GER6_CORDF|nr:hypothetical protein LEL_06081 [Akanthomyces lecanii RCEF 1005]
MQHGTPCIPVHSDAIVLRHQNRRPLKPPTHAPSPMRMSTPADPSKMVSVGSFAHVLGTTSMYPVTAGSQCCANSMMVALQSATLFILAPPLRDFFASTPPQTRTPTGWCFTPLLRLITLKPFAFPNRHRYNTGLYARPSFVECTADRP